MSTIGTVITHPSDSRLIPGVEISPFPLWPDDRGYFLEVARLTSATTTQVSAALSYPGTIKAFHIHQHQADLWVPAAGMLQVALVDLRPGSPTHSQINTFYIGALRPWQIRIPPQIAHGYKVIGRDPAVLVYLTDRFYDPTDEGRIPYNDPTIAYDWELQHK